MIDWMMAGALAAVLMAELVDAWALRELARRCQGIKPISSEDIRLVRWYAEGFEDSRAVTAWLRASSLVLTLLSVLLGAHALVILVSVLLAVGAHGECRFSAVLRRRFSRLELQAFETNGLRTNRR
ncbi:MAG: hypothetical protein ACT4PZ_20705 [Panacagrimonas sp.]